jgi:MFS family permease
MWDIMDAMRDQVESPQLGVKNILNRDYVVAFVAFFAFLAANHALTPTLPLYLARLGSNERDIGILVGIIGVSSLISRFLVGSILLKYSERSVMMGGAALFVLSFLALVVFRPFWPFLVVRLVQGIAFAALDTAAIAYIMKVVPETYQARAISYFLLAPSLAAAIASFSGVYVVNKYGFSFLLLGCMAMSLLAFFLSWNLKGRVAPKPAAVLHRNSGGLFHRKILAPALMCFMFYFSWAGVRAFFPLYSLQNGVANPGFFFSANAVMVVAVRLLGGRILDVYRKEKIIPVVMLVVVAGLIMLSFSHTLSMFIFIGLVWGAATAFLIPVAMAYALEFAGSSDGSAVGTYQAFMDLGLAVGPTVTGFIVPLTGYRVMFLILAFTCLVNIGYFQFYLRKKGTSLNEG